LRNPRVLLAAGVVVVAVVLGFVVLPGLGGDAGEGRDDASPVVRRTVRATLTLEQYRRPDTGARELLVSSPGPQFNGADLVRGTPIVWLRCFDRTGAQAVRTPYDWPLLEEPGFPPHIHQPADRKLLGRIRRCRLTGAGIDFQGTVTRGLPEAR